jgi:hypothetical protein
MPLKNMREPYVFEGYVTPSSLLMWLTGHARSPTTTPTDMSQYTGEYVEDFPYTHVQVPQAHQARPPKRKETKRDKEAGQKARRRDRDLNLSAMWARWEDRFGSRYKKAVHGHTPRSPKHEKALPSVSHPGAHYRGRALQVGPLDGIFPPGE